MRILIATDYYLPHVGGIPSHIHTIAKQFLKMGNEVCIIAPSKGFKDEVQSNANFSLFGIASVPSIVFSDMRFVPPFRSRKIAKIIKKFNPDVIHIHFSLGIGVAASRFAQKNHIPSVGTNHFMLENFFDNLPHPLMLKKTFENLIWKLAVRHLKNADIVTTPTKTAANYLSQKFIHNQITPLSNGVNFTKYNTRKIKNDVLKEYRIPKGNKVLLFVGRLVKEKRIDILINSLSKIIEDMPATLIIVGRGNKIVNYKGLARELGVEKNIIFADYLSDSNLLDLYKSSDVFVMPSIAELQSIATLEAMASGLPVVAANAGALPEIVINGRNGYLFKADSTTSLTKNILKIFSNKKLINSMSRESIAIAKEHDIAGVAFKFENIYQKAIAISLLGKAKVQATPFYLSRAFAVKLALVVLFLGILFRNSLASPSPAHARGLALKNKIMNSKIVIKIETLDSKIDNLRKTK
ncbi:MAG TPA: glycosyltransferase [Patescibacteria group bacterium]|nr:glycosyltransferase [Patescibacteria group bacterium]